MKVEHLKIYKDGLYATLSKDLEAFEKNFILISSGMLAFSITFIKDIVKIDGAVYLPWLYAGWLLMLLADGLMMFAFLYSVRGCNNLWKMVDNFMVTNDLFVPEDDLTLPLWKSIKIETNKELYRIKCWLEFLRYAAIGLFVAGVFSFGLFVSINISNENSKEKKGSPAKEFKINIKDAVITSSDSLFISTSNSDIKEKQPQPKK